jgi:Kelch motif
MVKKNVAAGAVVVTALLCLSATIQFGQSSWQTYGPAGRYQHTAIYDAGSDTMVIFGGQHTLTSQNYSDLWWLNDATTTACLPPCALQWTHANGNVPGTPSARFGHTAVYDTVNLRMVVFGGAEGVATPPPCLNDVHVLDQVDSVDGSS